MLNVCKVTVSCLSSGASMVVNWKHDAFSWLLAFTMVDVQYLEKHQMTLPGTLRWAAPELLTGNRGPSFLGECGSHRNTHVFLFKVSSCAWWFMVGCPILDHQFKRPDHVPHVKSPEPGQQQISTVWVH